MEGANKWEELAHDLYFLTAARLALTFQYDEAENQLITKGVAGIPMAISKTLSYLGMNMLKRRWPLYEGVKEDFLTGELILLESIEEVSSYNLSAYQSFYIQKVLGVEAIYSMGLLGSGGGLLGNFIGVSRHEVVLQALEKIGQFMEADRSYHTESF